MYGNQGRPQAATLTLPQNRRNDGNRQGNRKPAQQQQKKSKPTGHEAFLKGLEASKARLVIEMMSGDFIEGTVKRSDKYTVSLKTKEGTMVIFKHAIAAFTTPDAPDRDEGFDEAEA